MPVAPGLPAQHPLLMNSRTPRAKSNRLATSTACRDLHTIKAQPSAPEQAVLGDSSLTASAKRHAPRRGNVPTLLNARSAPRTLLIPQNRCSSANLRRQAQMKEWCSSFFRLSPRCQGCHRSPGHQIDGGSLAEILFGRSATRWLLAGIAANFRTVLAAHVPFQLMDRRHLRPSHDIEGYRLVGIAAEASNLKISVSGIECVAQRGGRLGWSLISEHALVPRLAREPIGFLARFLRTLRRMPDRAAIDRLA